MQVNSILERFLIKGAGKHLYRFSNADNKTWLMPAHNMQVAMNLYQPSGRNGKIMKALFPWLHHLLIIRKIIHAESVYCDITDELKRLFYQLFHETEIEFSIFCGTPCIHQKITMQISKGKHILGYCKVTDNKEIALLFRNEANILKELGRKGLKEVPICIFCGEMTDGIKLFVQSTAKTQKSQVIHEWTALHENFLDNLYQSTHQFIPFEQSDYYRILTNLQLHIEWLPQEVNGTLLTSTINQILLHYQGQEVDFSAYHADFTPWNMFMEGRKLFVFYWEYAQLTYPPKLDRYHFFTQTAYFEKHWTISQIIEYINSEQGKWIDQKMYSLYLLEVIARFTVREKGNINGKMAESFQIWIALLEYLQK